MQHHVEAYPDYLLAAAIAAQLLLSTSSAGSCVTQQGDCDMAEIKWCRPQTGNCQLVL